MGLREAQGLPKVMKQPARTLLSPVLAWLLTFWAVCLFMIQILAGSILLALATTHQHRLSDEALTFLVGQGPEKETCLRSQFWSLLPSLNPLSIYLHPPFLECQ